MSPSMNFPDRLRKYRKSNGWTQKQLAMKWYVSSETISAWESGRRRPDISIVPKLANELGMDRDELIEYISPSSVKSKENRNQETGPDRSEQNSSFVVFQNQRSCEMPYRNLCNGVNREGVKASPDLASGLYGYVPLHKIRYGISCEVYIRKESRKAKKIKVLTIRGDDYFIGSKSLLWDVMKDGSATIEALVLSPESRHITEELAEKLQKRSAEDIKGRMRMSLKYLTELARFYENFNVKCYNEEPIFKMLIFDDVMFVSSFALEVPKNDENAEMFMIQRGNALFAGFEKVYNELSGRSAIPD